MNRSIFSLLFALLFLLQHSLQAAEMELPPCPESPNCVSSQAPTTDSHYIVPFTIKSSNNEAWATIKQVLLSQNRTVITKKTDLIINAEATSLVFRFVDDITLLLDKEAGIIHIRSASRTGQSDFGVNRKRVETIRLELQKAGVIE